MSSNTGSLTHLKKLMQGKSSHTQNGKWLSNALELLKEVKKQEKKRRKWSESIRTQVLSVDNIQPLHYRKGRSAS
jgi:hypothetical protein